MAQLGRKGTSHGRWSVGVKWAILINQRGEIVDWWWNTANEHDTTFRELASAYKDETSTFSDLGVRTRGCDPENVHSCHKGEWNDRYVIECIFRWMTEKFHAKHMYHRVDDYLEMRLGALVAAFNILFKMNDYTYSMTWFEL